jgi:hypothetical protein
VVPEYQQTISKQVIEPPGPSPAPLVAMPRPPPSGGPVITPAIVVDDDTLGDQVERSGAAESDAEFSVVMIDKEIRTR